MNATLGAQFEGEELEKVGRVASASRTWGIPVVAEILSQRMMANHMDMSGRGSASLRRTSQTTSRWRAELAWNWAQT